MRNLREESLERSRGRRKENFNEEHRKDERNGAKTKHITTVSFHVMFSLSRFLAYFVKLAKKRRRPENVCNSMLTEILTYFNNHIYSFCVKWMTSHELLCLNVKLQSSIKRTCYSVTSPSCCSKLKTEGVKIISQTENVVKEVTVHVISVLVVD